jgi:hypothetical protein
MLVEITTASGQITCTPEHKFLTNMGLIEASEIKEGTRLFKGDEWQCRLISLFSRGINTGYRAIITGDTYGAAQDRRTSIGPYGSIISVLFQTGMRFITKMLTPLTTIFQTSNVAPFPFINASTPCSVTGTAFYVRPPTNAAPRPQNGTEPKKDVTGIPSMEKKHGNIANLMKRFANCAAKNISRLGLRAPNGAALIVNQKRDINRQETVYDLTVEREHCYVANGMLVSNSDAFRTFACGFRPKAKSVPVTSILDEYNYGGRW